MAAKKQRKPSVQVEDIAAPVEALTPEQAEAAEGGIIAILIGLKSQQASSITDGTDILIGAGAGAPGGH